MRGARVRREYRTADEVLAEAAERPQEAPKQTIIDMRGPQARLPLSCASVCWLCGTLSLPRGTLPLRLPAHHLGELLQRHLRLAAGGPGCGRHPPHWPSGECKSHGQCWSATG